LTRQRAFQQISQRVVCEPFPVGIGHTFECVQPQLGDVTGQKPDHGTHLRLAAENLRGLKPLRTQLQTGQREPTLTSTSVQLAGGQGETHGLTTCQYRISGRSIRIAPSATTGSRPISNRTASRSSTVPPHQRRYRTPRNALPTLR